MGVVASPRAKALFDHVVERSDMRQTLRLLRSGRTLWYAPDQDYGRNILYLRPSLMSLPRLFAPRLLG